jgi:hypothetical protein
MRLSRTAWISLENARAGRLSGIKRNSRDMDKKMAARQEKADKGGKKPRGRAPVPPVPGPEAKDQVNLTDEESRIMPVSGGGFEQCYNAQAAVDVESLLIVTTGVSQNTNDIDAYITPRREPHYRDVFERFKEEAEPLETEGPAEKMAQKLRTLAGRELYARRKCTIEPVFGIIKAAMGFRQFMLRGLASVRGEWTLVCTAWNLKRLHKLTI